jgi:hypothetical protein
VKKSPTNDFFYGYQKGADFSARTGTGIFGKWVIVGGVRFSLWDGPPCIYTDKKQPNNHCDDCEFFSPLNCLLRYDEYLLEDIRRFIQIGHDRVEQYRRKERAILKLLHKELRAHGRPLHYTVISRIMISRYPKLKMTIQRTYRYLNRHPDWFDKIDTGIYRAKARN